MGDYYAINFIQFWLWEYQRRNATYRKDYDVFIRKLSDKNISYNDTIYLTERTNNDLYLERLNFLEKHKRDPEDHNHGLPSETILKDVASGKFVYPKYEPKGLFMTTKIVKSDLEKLILQIDLNEDVELICKEVRCICNDYNLRSMLNKIGMKSPSSAIRKQNRLTKGSIEELLKAQMKVKKGKMHDLPRAVGLWLWDQKYESTPPVRSRKKVIEKFHSTFDELLIQEDDAAFNEAYLNNDDHLYRLLNRTNGCIEKVEILQMK